MDNLRKKKPQSYVKNVRKIACPKRHLPSEYKEDNIQRCPCPDRKCYYNRGHVRSLDTEIKHIRQYEMCQQHIKYRKQFGRERYKEVLRTLYGLKLDFETHQVQEAAENQRDNFILRRAQIPKLESFKKYHLVLEKKVSEIIKENHSFTNFMKTSDQIKNNGDKKRFQSTTSEANQMKTQKSDSALLKKVSDSFCSKVKDFTETEKQNVTVPHLESNFDKYEEETSIADLESFKKYCSKQRDENLNTPDVKCNINEDYNDIHDKSLLQKPEVKNVRNSPIEIYDCDSKISDSCNAEICSTFKDIAINTSPGLFKNTSPTKKDIFEVKNIPHTQKVNKSSSTEMKNADCCPLNITEQIHSNFVPVIPNKKTKTPPYSDANEIPSTIISIENKNDVKIFENIFTCDKKKNNDMPLDATRKSTTEMVETKLINSPSELKLPVTIQHDPSSGKSKEDTKNTSITSQIKNETEVRDTKPLVHEIIFDEVQMEVSAKEKSINFNLGNEMNYTLYGAKCLDNKNPDQNCEMKKSNADDKNKVDNVTITAIPFKKETDDEITKNNSDDIGRVSFGEEKSLDGLEMQLKSERAFLNTSIVSQIINEKEVTDRKSLVHEIMFNKVQVEVSAKEKLINFNLGNEMTSTLYGAKCLDNETSGQNCEMKKSNTGNKNKVDDVTVVAIPSKEETKDKIFKNISDDIIRFSFDEEKSLDVLKMQQKSIHKENPYSTNVVLATNECCLPLTEAPTLLKKEGSSISETYHMSDMHDINFYSNTIPHSVPIETSFIHHVPYFCCPINNTYVRQTPLPYNNFKRSVCINPFLSNNVFISKEPSGSFTNTDINDKLEVNYQNVASHIGPNASVILQSALNSNVKAPNAEVIAGLNNMYQKPRFFNNDSESMKIPLRKPKETEKESSEIYPAILSKRIAYKSLSGENVASIMHGESREYSADLTYTTKHQQTYKWDKPEYYTESKKDTYSENKLDQSLNQVEKVRVGHTNIHSRKPTAILPGLEE